MTGIVPALAGGLATMSGSTPRGAGTTPRGIPPGGVSTFGDANPGCPTGASGFAGGVVVCATAGPLTTRMAQSSSDFLLIGDPSCPPGGTQHSPVGMRRHARTRPGEYRPRHTFLIADTDSAGQPSAAADVPPHPRRHRGHHQ